ncbi:25764_t:CDS:1, partial [Gigaspora rosea]
FGVKPPAIPNYRNIEFSSSDDDPDNRENVPVPTNQPTNQPTNHVPAATKHKH